MNVFPDDDQEDEEVDLSTYYDNDNFSFLVIASSGEELANESSATFFISPSGVPSVDRKLLKAPHGGSLGYAAGRVYELLGVSGSGKSQLCLASAVSSALWSPVEGEVLYICSKAGTVLPRLLEMLRSTISKRVTENGITVAEAERKRRRVVDRESRIGSSLIATLPLAAARLASFISDTESIEKLLRFDVVKSVDIEANEILKRIRIIYAYSAQELLSILSIIESKLHVSSEDQRGEDDETDLEEEEEDPDKRNGVLSSSVMMVIIDGLSNSILSSVYRIEGRALGLGMIAEIGHRLSYLAKHHDLPILVSNLSIADCSDFSDDGSLIDFVEEEIIDESIEAQMIIKSFIFETPKEKLEDVHEMTEDFKEDEIEMTTEFDQDSIAMEEVEEDNAELKDLNTEGKVDEVYLIDGLYVDTNDVNLEQEDIDDLIGQDFEENEDKEEREEEGGEEEEEDEEENPFFFRLLKKKRRKNKKKKRLNNPGPRVSLSTSWRIIPDVSLHLFMDETAENDDIASVYIPGQPPSVKRLISDVTRKMTTRANINEKFATSSLFIPTLLRMNK